MRAILLGLAAFALAGCAIAPAPADLKPAGLQATDLLGTWDVEIYYSETEPPSSTELVITQAADGKLKGSFYQSEFQAANYSIRRGVLAFGATTTDGTAPYSHSGRLVEVGDTRVIEGQTLSSGRSFLMIWTARKRAG